MELGQKLDLGVASAVTATPMATPAAEWPPLELLTAHPQLGHGARRCMHLLSCNSRDLWCCRESGTGPRAPKHTGPGPPPAPPGSYRCIKRPPPVQRGGRRPPSSC